MTLSFLLLRYLDGQFVYGVDASALQKTGASIPEEPMYVILNTAVSSTWGFPTICNDVAEGKGGGGDTQGGCPCDCFDCRDPLCQCAVPPDMCANLPASMLIDYVRVYQATGDSEGERWLLLLCAVVVLLTKTHVILLMKHIPYTVK